MIPKVFRPLFKVKPPQKSTKAPIIYINGEHFVPITKTPVKPVVVDGVTYIPVHTAPEYANKSAPVLPTK